MRPSRPEPLLLGCPGCGSAIVECAFALAGLPLAVEDVDYSPGSPTRERLLAVNPLGQVPALVLPDGRVLTESLAIVHWIDDRAPRAGLVPARGDPAREAFYRWVTFLVAAVYPTFTYGDEPRKWVADEACAKRLRESTDRHREALWRQMDAEAASPWFLGERPSAIDLYLLVMTRWRPGGAWIPEHAPALAAIAARAGALEALAPLLKRHFP
ncbi:MAG: glutathione S-transferase family protein [Burkholderiales bacterium]